jgi:hypothetical protein
MPVLDAKASGIPVICLAGTSMAEFSEGSCILCETGEPEELLERLQHLLNKTTSELSEVRRVWPRRRSFRSDAVPRKLWRYIVRLSNLYVTSGLAGSLIPSSF